MLQRVFFPLILVTTTDGKEAKLQKTLALRSFQITQEVSIMREAKYFLLVPLTKMKSSQQSLTESKFAQVEVSTKSIPSEEMREFQTLIVYRHLKKRCAAVLGSLLHNWQLPQFGHPRL
jgi:hypothetical protein